MLWKSLLGIGAEDGKARVLRVCTFEIEVAEIPLGWERRVDMLQILETLPDSMRKSRL